MRFGRTVDELARYTRVPGVVGKLVDWIAATSRRPNRVLALGAAVSVVGTLIGRRVAGPTRSATHLYGVGVARSHLQCPPLNWLSGAEGCARAGR
jgi:hypothetical protein